MFKYPTIEYRYANEMEMITCRIPKKFRTTLTTLGRGQFSTGLLIALYTLEEELEKFHLENKKKVKLKKEIINENE